METLQPNTPKMLQKGNIIKAARCAIGNGHDLHRYGKKYKIQTLPMRHYHKLICYNCDAVFEIECQRWDGGCVIPNTRILNE